MYDGNLLYCEPCWALPKTQCNSTIAWCDLGILDASKKDMETGVVGQSRIDTAIGIFANASASYRCSGAVNQCPLPMECAAVGDSAASYVLLTSLSAISGLLAAVNTALGNAENSATDQAVAFASIFCPKPNANGAKLGLAIGLSILSGVIGLIPAVGSKIKDLNSIASAGANTGLTQNTDFQEPDLTSAIGLFAKQITATMKAETEAIFINGTYGSTHAVNLTELMRGGGLFGVDVPGANDPQMGALVTGYVQVMYAQLGVAAWQHFQIQEAQFNPFITFAKGSCASLDYTNPYSVPFANVGLEHMDSNFDYNGSCYWLLAAVAGDDSATPSGMSRRSPIGSGNDDTCINIQALPGGSRKTLADNSQQFSNLSLENFIIPSVEGWIQNDRTNGFPLGNGTTALAPNPFAAGLLNISVCDYLYTPLQPGDNCPIYGLAGEGKCNGEGYAKNTPTQNSLDYMDGSWQPGTCRVEMMQSLRDSRVGQGDDFFQPESESNPEGTGYQLFVTIFDNDARVIGNAAKTFVYGTWEVQNSALPYNLYIQVQDNDNDPLVLWYSDQYWKTFDQSPMHSSTMGPWDSNTRTVSTLFACPMPDGTPPESATKANPLPTNSPIQNVIPFGDAAVNTFTGSDYPPRPTWKPEAPSKYAADPANHKQCMIQVTQYDINYGETHTGQYQFEGYLWDINGTPLSAGSNGQILATAGEAMDIYGLNDKLTVSFDANQGDMQFVYYPNGQALSHWNSGDWWGTSTPNTDDDGQPYQHHACDLSGWTNSVRAVRCSFQCY